MSDSHQHPYSSDQVKFFGNVSGWHEEADRELDILHLAGIELKFPRRRRRQKLLRTAEQ